MMISKAYAVLNVLAGSCRHTKIGKMPSSFLVVRKTALQQYAAGMVPSSEEASIMRMIVL